MFEEYQGKHICLLGFGREWQSTLSFLRSHDLADHVTICDQTKFDDLDEERKKLSEWCEYLSWETWLDELWEYDVVFRSPWIGPLNYDLSAARFLTSQTDFFFRHYEGKVVAVTGTKGKSTTSQLMYQVLNDQDFDVALVGNIGKMILTEIDFAHDYDYVVCELSSFQLCDVKLNPFAAVLVNLWVDHLAYHKTLDHYHGSKWHIVGDDTKTFLHESIDPPWYVSDTVFFGKNASYRFDDGVFYRDDVALYSSVGMKLLGDHNKWNVCGVNAVCDLIGVDWLTVEKTVVDFSALAHRLEFIGEYRGVRWINDSQATSPTPCLAAMRAFGKDIGCMMLWWTDSGFDYAAVIATLMSYAVPVVILFPDTIADFRTLLDKGKEGLMVLEARTVEEAVKLAYEHCPVWKVCLMSPAAKSFSICKNVYERWDLFRAWVKKLA